MEFPQKKLSFQGKDSPPVLMLNLANLKATQTTYISDTNQWHKEFNCQKYPL